MIRVVLPHHLKNLAKVEGEVQFDLTTPVRIVDVLNAVEARYPVLRGTIREHSTLKRRAFVRFYACEEDLSHLPTDTPLPHEIVTGAEPFLIVGAMAGG